MKADSHIHLFKYGFLGTSAIDAEVSEYEKLQNLGGIDSALVIGYEGNHRYQGNNSYILELAKTHTWIHPVCFLNLQAASVDRQIRLAREEGFVGFSLYLDENSTTISDDLVSALNKVGQAGAILSINASPESLVKVQDQIAAMSSCALLISHLGLPGPESAKTPAAIRQRIAPLLKLQGLPHVFVKLSGFYAIDSTYPYYGAQPYVSELLESFGASRLMWGSDYSPSMAYGTPVQVANLPSWLVEQLSSDEHEKITSSNLRGLLTRAIL